MRKLTARFTLTPGGTGDRAMDRFTAALYRSLSLIPEKLIPNDK